MARLLVVGVEPVLTAALEDRLLPAGHQIEPVQDGARAVSMAVEKPIDLIVVAMDLPPSSGLAVVRALRSHDETRGLPILILANHAGAQDRVRALRAGADDSVSLPCDLDELVLRVERLLGLREAEPGVLQGDLAGHPLWELLQSAQQTGKSGFIEVSGRRSSGRIELHEGKVVAAHWQRLRGQEACLAVLGVKDGRFRFTSTDPQQGDRAPAASATSIQSLLLEASRLEDELERRSRSLPSTGAPLELVADREHPPQDRPLGPPGSELVYQRIRKYPGTRLFDLLEQIDLAPLRIRLALAHLVEEAFVAPTEAVDGTPSTTRLAFSALLQVATLDLLDAAGMTSRAPGLLPVLLLADAASRPRLAEMLASVPSGHPDLDSFSRLSERLAAGQSGSALMTAQIGKLSIHAHPVAEEEIGRIAGVLPACGAVLLWIGAAAAVELLPDVHDWPARLKPPATAIVVADGREALSWALDRFGHGDGWRITAHPPHSILGVLRLLHPGPSA